MYVDLDSAQTADHFGKTRGQAFLVHLHLHHLVVEDELVLVGQPDLEILEILGDHAGKGYSIVTWLAASTYGVKQLAAAAAAAVGTVDELAFVVAFAADEFVAEDVVGN